MVFHLPSSSVSTLLSLLLAFSVHFFIPLLSGGCASLLLDFLHKGGSKVWWHVSLIIFLKRQRQTDFYEDEPSLLYIASSRTETTGRTHRETLSPKQTSKEAWALILKHLFAFVKSYILVVLFLLFFLIFFMLPLSSAMFGYSYSPLSYHLFSLMIL